MMKGLRVIGCPVAIHTRLDPSIRAKRLEGIGRLVEEAGLRPHVSMRFPLADFKSALRAKWERKVLGHCVVHPPAAKLM
jgi:NADPH:quinone reductase-like Zn-dependent oxidoreductase